MPQPKRIPPAPRLDVSFDLELDTCAQLSCSIAAGRSYVAEGRIVHVQVNPTEVVPVERIEHLKSKLHIHRFSDSKVLLNRGVLFELPRCANG